MPGPDHRGSDVADRCESRSVRPLFRHLIEGAPDVPIWRAWAPRVQRPFQRSVRSLGHSRLLSLVPLGETVILRLGRQNESARSNLTTADKELAGHFQRTDRATPNDAVSPPQNAPLRHIGSALDPAMGDSPSPSSRRSQAGTTVLHTTGRLSLDPPMRRG